MVHPFCTRARIEIKTYLKDSGQTLRWLALKAGIPYHRLYRVQSGEAQGFPVADARSLLEVILPDSAAELVRQYYPSETASLEPRPSPQELQNQLLEFVQEDDFRLEVFWYVKMGRPKSKDDIKSRYSDRGLETLEELLQEGVVVLSGEFYKSCLDAELTSSVKTLREDACKSLNKLDFDQLGAFMRVDQVALNADGQTEVYNATVKFAEELARIAKDPKLAGDRGTVLIVGTGPMRGVKRV